MPRGNRVGIHGKKGRLNWDHKKANRGRKPSLGKRPGFTRWKEVRAAIRRNATEIIVPPEEEREAFKKAKAEFEGKTEG